jgi:DTW domain-containing protein
VSPTGHPGSIEPRRVCASCRRPLRVCYCSALPQLTTMTTRTRVVILQHPRERDMPIGTARMASLCLPQSSLHVGVRWDNYAPLARLLHDPQRPAVLLYPADGARDILADPPLGPVTLVVVDGTWSQAKNVVRDSAVLRALPRYAFSAPEPSQYRIRREPRDEYVSTIEALMYVLGALEGDAPRFRALLEPLRAMVDAQLAANERTPRFRQRRRLIGRNGPRIPELVRTRYPDLVCVVGEANAWPFRDGAKRYPDQLVHWVAERVASGERISVLSAPVDPLSPSTSFHTGIDEAVLLAAGGHQRMVRSAIGFLRSSDVLCAWGHHSPNLLASALVDTEFALPAQRLDLRAAVQRLRNAKIGSLEDVGEQLRQQTGGHPWPAAGPGRAGRRLAVLTELLRSWHRQISEAPASEVAP